MTRLVVAGFLICRSLEEADRIAALVPEHIRLTLAEPGCRKCEVVRSMADPVRFAIRKTFVDDAALKAHLARAVASGWTRATRRIPRDIRITRDQASPGASF